LHYFRACVALFSLFFKGGIPSPHYSHSSVPIFPHHSHHLGASLPDPPKVGHFRACIWTFSLEHDICKIVPFPSSPVPKSIIKPSSNVQRQNLPKPRTSHYIPFYFGSFPCLRWIIFVRT